MDRLKIISILFFSLLLNAAWAQKQKLDSMCRIIFENRDNFIPQLKYNNYWKKGGLSIQDIEQINNCYLDRLKKKPNLREELPVVQLKVNWLMLEKQLGAAILEADQYHQKCRETGTETDIIASYAILCDLYFEAAMNEETYYYSSLKLHAMRKLGNKKDISLATRMHAWFSFVYGKEGHPEILDSSVYYMRSYIKDYMPYDNSFRPKDEQHWVTIDSYKILAMALNKLNRNEELIQLSDKAVSIARTYKPTPGTPDFEQNNSLTGIFLSYKAAAYRKLNKLDSALVCMQEPEIYSLRKNSVNVYSTEEKKYVDYYHVLEKTKIYLGLNQPKRALRLLDDAVFSDQALTATNNFLQLMYGYAAPIYEKYGEFAKATVCYRKYGEFKDSLQQADNKNRIESEKANSLVQINYQKKIAQSEKERIENEKEHDKQVREIVIIGGAFVAAVLLVFLVILYKRFRETQAQKRIIEEQEKQTQEQKNTILKQKTLVEEKQKEIYDSINYAERIQRSLMASDELLNNNLKEHFVFFRPKDIVSGDFYRAARLPNGHFAVITADSTGHGVPGAIMSIMNIYCLKEASKDGALEPADILNQTREKIIATLKQDGSKEGGKDGMDCSLISLNFNNSKMLVAAANNPVWIIRNKEFIEIKPDKMPVGKHEKDQIPFTQHELEMKEGDAVYCFTDGLPDQFGGPKGKKFMYKQMKELFLSLCELPMQEQRGRIEQAFLNWKGELEQVDDVCIIGIKI